MTAVQTKLEVNYRWLFILLSVLPFFLLRGNRPLLIGYCAGLSALLVLALLWLPRRVAEAERRFSRESLRLLSAGDFAGLERLAGRQRLLTAFGRRHLVPETLGLAASAAGDHERARAQYTLALAAARPDERLRIEVNLAGEELATGRLPEAEGRYRTVLHRRPDLPLALGNLGRVLLLRGHEFDEAADLLRRALLLADTREAGTLRLALAETLIHLHAPASVWSAELALASAAGVPVEAVERVRGLAHV